MLCSGTEDAPNKVMIFTYTSRFSTYRTHDFTHGIKSCHHQQTVDTTFYLSNPKLNLILQATIINLHPPLPVSKPPLSANLHHSLWIFCFQHWQPYDPFPLVPSLLGSAGSVASIARSFYEASSCVNPPNGTPIALEHLQIFVVSVLKAPSCTLPGQFSSLSKQGCP